MVRTTSGLTGVSTGSSFVNSGSKFNTSRLFFCNIWKKWIKIRIRIWLWKLKKIDKKMSKFCLTIIAKKKITSFINFCTKIRKKKKVRLFERFWNSMKDDKILQFWVWMEVWSFDPRDPSIWCPWRKCDVWWPLRLHAPLRIPIASIHFSAWTAKKEKYVKIQSQVFL